MPLDLFAVIRSRKSVRFQEPLNEHVVRQQQRYKRYGYKLSWARESKLNPGDQLRIRLPNRASKFDPGWTEPDTVVETPSEDTETLDDRTTWNNEKLRVESPASSPGKQPQQPVAADPLVATPRRSERALRRPSSFIIGELSSIRGEEKCSIRMSPDIHSDGRHPIRLISSFLTFLS